MSSTTEVRKCRGPCAQVLPLVSFKRADGTVSIYCRPCSKLNFERMRTPKTQLRDPKLGASLPTHPFATDALGTLLLHAWTAGALCAKSVAYGQDGPMGEALAEKARLAKQQLKIAEETYRASPEAPAVEARDEDNWKL